jgi:hypothetical protein
LIEWKADAILRHFGIDFETFVHGELLGLVKPGRKIEALRLQRLRSGGRLPGSDRIPG